MNWTAKVDERTKEKIELLYRQFDKFIEQNHSASSEDGLVLKEWSNFKQLIEKNPTDFESMHHYLSKLGEDQRSQIRITKENTIRKSSSANTSIDINKTKLKKISGDVLGAIGKNNKELFR